MVEVEVETYLAAGSFGLTAATNLFHGAKPEDPDSVVVIRKYGGLKSEPKIGTRGINIEFPKIQVLVRGPRGDYDTPNVLAQQIMAYLMLVGDSSLSGVWYGAIEPDAPPFSLGQDGNDRYEIVCNYQITKDYSA